MNSKNVYLKSSNKSASRFTLLSSTATCFSAFHRIRFYLEWQKSIKEKRAHTHILTLVSDTVYKVLYCKY